MTVLYLSSCPPSLRGDLTKWLMEIATGVYVGRISARVRDKLWERVVETAKGGRAVLVFSTNNEQRMDFRVHGETWEPIDFDGLKLILRPSPARLKAKQSKRVEKKAGFSNAAKFQRAKRFSKKSYKNDNIGDKTNIENAEFPESYVAIDIETTGLGSAKADIIEIGALKIIYGEIVDSYQSFVKIEKSVPEAITRLTGITDEDLAEDGKVLADVISSFTEFVGEMPLVAHNMPFDLSFLNAAFERSGVEKLTNKTFDTLALAKRICPNLSNYKLGELANYFDFEFDNLNNDRDRLHRSMGDCYITNLLFQKLMKLEQVGL